MIHDIVIAAFFLAMIAAPAYLSFLSRPNKRDSNTYATKAAQGHHQLLTSPSRMPAPTPAAVRPTWR